MELLQKISKKYLALAAVMLVGMMGVVSCDCGGKKDEETTGKPSISLEKDNLVGTETTTNLKIEGSSYKSEAYTVKIVNLTNGSVKIGNVLFDIDSEKPLNEVLGINGEEVVAADQSQPVEITVTDAKKDFSVTIKLVDKEDNEVGSVDLSWKPAVIAGLEATISELVNDKVTVTVTAKKVGSPVDLTADDLQGLTMEVSSNQSNPGESATIVEPLKFKDSDIKSGAISKEFTVKKGTKNTILSIIIYKGADKITGKITGGDKKVTVLAAEANYEFALRTNKIEDGATKATITVKGKDELKTTELEKLKLSVKRTKGSYATIAGQADAKLDLKNATKLVISNTNNKEASLDLVIEPKGDKQATFRLELLDEKELSQGTQDLNWEDGINLDIDAVHDRVSDKVNITIKNNGKAQVKDLALSFERTAGNKALLNDKADGVVDALASDKVVKQDTPFIQELSIKFNGDKNATFKFSLKHNTTLAVEKPFTYTAAAPDVQIDLKDKKTSYKGDAETQVTFTITAGADELTKEDLQAVSLVYTSPEKGTLTDKSVDVQAKNLQDLLGINQLEKNKAVELVLSINNNDQQHVTFTAIKLQGSKEETTNGVAKIEWQGEPKVKISLGSVSIKDKKVIVKLENNSGFKLEENDLKAIKLKYDKTAGFLKKGKDDANNKNLFELGVVNMNVKATVNLELTVDNANVASVKFTNVQLENSIDPTTISEIKWEGELNVEIGDPKVDNGTKKVTFSVTNNSGMDLAQAELEKIHLTYATTKGTLKKDGNEIKGKSLWDLLGKAIDSNKSEALAFDIDNDKAAHVVFTDIQLTESTSKTKVDRVEWKGELDVQIGGGTVAKNQVTFTVTNNSGFVLGEKELGTIKLTYATTKGTLKKDGNEVKGKSLWELLGKAIVDSTPVDLVVDIDNAGEADVKFTDVKLTGSKSNVQVAEVKWKGAISFEMTGKVDLGAKTVTLTVKNNSGFKLSQAQLKDIKLDYIASNKGLLKQGTKDAKNSTLWKLLGEKAIEDAQSKDFVLLIDNASEAAVTFEKVRLVQGTTELTVINQIEWKGACRVNLGSTAVVDEKAKTATLNLTNKSGFKLGEEQLKNIKLTYGKTHGSLQYKKNESKGASLFDLGVQNLNDKQKVDLMLDIVDEGRASVEFTQVELAGSTETEKIEKIEWVHIELGHVNITTPNDDAQSFIGAASYLVKFKAAKEAIKPEWLTVTIESTQGVTFKDKNGAIINKDTQLSTLDRAPKKELNTTDEFELVDLQVDNENGKDQSEVTVTIKYKNEAVATRKITWKKS